MQRWPYSVAGPDWSSRARFGTASLSTSSTWESRPWEHNPQKSTKTGDGVVNSPVEIGGVWITPGQTVHSDEDGIVVVGHSPAGR